MNTKLWLIHITKPHFQTPINPKVINPHINPFTTRQLDIQTVHKNNFRQIFLYLVFFQRLQTWLKQ